MTETKYKSLAKVSPSQWGGIRSIASNNTNIEDVIKSLFDNDKGYLNHGIAYEKIWGKNGDSKLKLFKELVNYNKSLGPIFVAKLAAEFAKISKAEEND